MYYGERRPCRFVTVKLHLRHCIVTPCACNMASRQSGRGSCLASTAFPSMARPGHDMRARFS
jgi:hypothetical protein